MPPSKKTPKKPPAAQSRQRILQRMLRDRQRELQTVLQRRVPQTPASHRADGLDATEQAEAHVQEHIEAAVIQMKVEALERISEALVRLKSSEYGNCVECRGEIAESRLRAVPFAVRCTACEGAREAQAADEQRWAERQRVRTAWSDEAGA
jgi:DnaK suppressor protein